MRQGLQKQLFEDFPIFFGRSNLPINQTCMCWGCDCGDGWEPIIRKVAKQIEDYNSKCPDTDIENLIQAEQVKEKFGGLRIYLNHDMEWTDKIIEEAEDLSEITCENCGASGTPNNKGWIITLCDKCREDRNK